VRVPLLVMVIGCCGFAQPSPPVTNIQAIHHDGQTFLTWTDAAAEAAGATYRYDVYRSVAPISDSASLKAATLIQAGLFNNSGQVVGQFPYTQATRQNAAKSMAIIKQELCGGPTAYTVCGTPLLPFTGLSVHTTTAAESAYYAVITVDRTHRQSESAIFPGNNATMLPVYEQPADLVPLKYYDSHDSVHRTRASSSAISGTQGLPLWVNLHASGGCPNALVSGDEYIFWGDASMGYQEGIPGIFTVWEDRTGSTHGRQSLVLSPCDAVWTSDGLGQLQTVWFGYTAVPLGASDPVARALPITEARLLWMLNWVIRQYGVDPNRIVDGGTSMGGWGTSSWALRHPELFSALFPAMPRWRQISYAEPSKTTYARATPSSPVMADQKTPYLHRMDSVAFVQADCGQNLPFIGWAIGRQDGYATWQEQVDMVNALKACHFGFAFSWNNGSHSEGPAALPVLTVPYQARFAKNLSYPAFTNSSLDSNPGSGSPTDGDLTGCINCGFIWTDPAETPTTWSASISNSNNSGSMTVDVSPRNVQAFRPAVGTAVSWSTSAGESGVSVVDQFGIVTAQGVTMNGTASVKLTFSTATTTPRTHHFPPSPPRSGGRGRP
jgi:hypothetical protein